MTAAPRRASLPRTGRRAVLLGGAAAAVGGAVVAGALLRIGGPAAPSAASSGGAAPGDGSSAAPFADIGVDHPAAEAIRWAHETGVQPALSATDYSPQTAVARGDVAVALHRLAGTPAVDLEGTPMLFTDLGEDPSLVAAVLWLHGRGALWGDAQLRARPEDPATQDGTAVMLSALLRPSLAGVGVEWVARTDGAGDAPVTRADLAVSLHRANTVITAALG